MNQQKLREILKLKDSTIFDVNNPYHIKKIRTLYTATNKRHKLTYMIVEG